MKIRKAKKTDLKKVVELFLEESSKKPYSQNYSLKDAKKRVGDMFNFGTIYLAFVDKKIVGFISMAGEGKEDIYIDEFWLKTEYQRKGIGSKLLVFIQKEYKKVGAKTISVMTSKKAGAFKFYKKFKFKEDKSEVILKNT
jgi:ribosomal protein S18 acetylase RimI-like enzyme